MSRRDKVLAYLEAEGPFEGSVADLAVEMAEPSGALSAAVSLLIKDGLVKRHPDAPGAVAEWLWLPSQPTPEALVVDAEIVELQEPLADEAASEPVAEPEPVGDGFSDPRHTNVLPQPDDAGPMAQRGGIRYPEQRGKAADVVVLDDRVERADDGPSPMRVTLDVSPWQIRVDGRSLSNREARALVRDLQTALCVVEAPFV